MKRIYIAGPMTGLPDFNYPAFNAEAARLRALGYHVENPAESGLPLDLDWSVYLKAALRQMLTCDEIVRLDGWTTSKGAILEVYVAGQLGIMVHDPEAVPV